MRPHAQPSRGQGPRRRVGARAALRQQLATTAMIPVPSLPRTPSAITAAAATAAIAATSIVPKRAAIVVVVVVAHDDGAAVHVRARLLRGCWALWRLRKRPPAAW